MDIVKKTYENLQT